MQAAPRPEQSFKDLFDTLAAQIERVLRGKRRAVHLSLVCLFSEGHLLIEDVPGVGKTSLAKAIARSTGGSWRRVQFTPDLLPSDITGVSVWDRGARRLRVPARWRVRERRARRRDQPRVAQDAVGAARVDGGTSGQRRRADVQAAAPVHGDRHAEPGRARRHVSAARSAARPLLVAPADRLSRSRRRDRDPRRARATTRSIPTSSSRSPTPETVAAWIHELGRIHVVAGAAGLHRRPRRGDAPSPRPHAGREPARRAGAAARVTRARGEHRARRTSSPTT